MDVNVEAASLFHRNEKMFLNALPDRTRMNLAFEAGSLLS
jgi:hypothetical protein